MKEKDKICFALDVDSIEEVKYLVDKVKDYVGIFKVGFQLYNREGKNVIKAINEIGGKVFLDLKLHDIPNTVANAGKAITLLQVHMFNLHASGGYQMMKKTTEEVSLYAKKTKIEKPLILAVTVLTSISEQAFKEEMMIDIPLEEYVVHLAKLSRHAGMDGVIASPKEIRGIRETCGNDFLIVTPGVRPSWADTDDQQRIMTPREAIRAGSDMIVIGRPIRCAPDPAEAAKKILEEIEK